MIPITRYDIKEKCLIPWVKFIWHLEACNARICNKLLPTDSIDLILNRSGDMIYKAESDTFIPASLHVNGLRNQYSYIYQNGSIQVWGVSFYAYGLYPFIHRSLEGMKDQIINLDTLTPSLAQKMELAVSNGNYTDVVTGMEQALCSELSIWSDDIYKAKLIQALLKAEEGMTIQAFCKKHGINIKTMERISLRHTGYAPKVLRQISRFQTASNQMVHGMPRHFSDLAYDNGFADQAHFNKVFQKFSGVAPRVFQEEKVTLKENVQYQYR